MRRIPAIDLQSLNTLALPSNCAEVLLISDPDELSAFLLALAPEQRRKQQIAGELSNTVLGEELQNSFLLFRDGGITDISRNSDGILVRAPGSCHFDALVARLCDEGIPGLELLSGIPGTLGAAIVQNIAAYGQRLSERFLSARALDLKSGAIIHLNADAMNFAYRASVLKGSATYTPSLVVLDVVLRFPKDARLDPITYDDVRRRHSELGRETDDIVGRRMTVLEVRQRKGMVVGGANWLPCAGSFFVSPVLPEERALHIARLIRGSQFADSFLSWYRPGAGETRCPAALVIRAAGFLNGDRWGPVGLSPHHILAICNYSSATASDVAAVAALVQSKVAAIFGISLETEVRYAGLIEHNPDVTAFLRNNMFSAGSGEPEWVRGIGVPES